MPIKIYNTLTSKKETFKPLKANEVKMYNCGPTVYDTVHIGNLRTLVMNDLLRRMFEYSGYKVTHAMNITDVDDKTLKRSREENVPLKSITQKYEDHFMSDMKSLNILNPHHLMRATDNIKEMIEMIGILLEKDIAYKTSDGVYMSIGKVKGYGRLAHLTPASILAEQSGYERIKGDEYEKENPRDFALWKFHSAEDGEVLWEAPFGKGRPGWHIECSAMSIKALGETIDIHSGGTDLIFPHHTNEIAQSETVTGKTFVNYWVHGAFLMMNDEKMSKSKKNFFKIADLLEEKVSPLAFRFWLLQSHYRTQANFKLDAVLGAQQGLFRLIHTYISLPDGGEINEDYKERFLAFIQDDLDMPNAVALAWELIKDPNLSGTDKKATLKDFDKVFGIGFDAFADMPDFSKPIQSEDVPPEIDALASLRLEARQQKEWDKADVLRKEIAARGYEVIDIGDNFEIRKL